MTWDASKPANNESPALAPAQIRTNWSRIQAMITKDHIFNASQDTDDGYHKIIHHVTQSGDIGNGSPAPDPGTGLTYTKTITTTGDAGSTAGDGEHLCYQRGTNGGSLQEAALSVCPVRAAVNFSGRNNSGTCDILWAYNVSAVERLSGTGDYRVDFETNLPSEFYCPTIMAMRTSSDEAVNCQVQGAASYGTSVKVESLTILFNRASSSSQVDPLNAFVVIFGG